MDLIIEAPGTGTAVPASNRELAASAAAAAPEGNTSSQAGATEGVPERNRFGARAIFAAERPPRRRWPSVSAVALLLGSMVAGATLHAWVAPAISAPRNDRGTTGTPPSAIKPAAPEPAPTMRERPRPSSTEKRARRSAEIIELLPITGSEMQVSHRSLLPDASPKLTAAYGAYVQGDALAAQTAYEEIVAADPENRQALLGLAALASHRGEPVQARRLYVRLLERDPADPIAAAALLDLEAPADLPARESRIKSLISGHPDVAPLHALLGDLYVRGQRWSEARQAYDRALVLQGTGKHDPVIEFNLAVTLDHLGQGRAALTHYRSALASAAGRTPAFDPAMAEARVRALSEI